MDVIKNMAKEFYEELGEYSYDLVTLDGQISSKLLSIRKDSEKLRFLSYLKDFLETDFQEHVKICTEGDECTINKRYENTIYSVRQQYEEYSEGQGIPNLAERPAMQFFVEGQYFDAFTAIKEQIKQASKSIILIDNYVDSHTLAFFPGKEPSIKLRILTTSKSLNESFDRAVELYNRQFGNLKTKSTNKYHDRFLVLDETFYYHIGASIKDAGNKTFMFSKIEDEDVTKAIMDKIKTEWQDILA